MPSPTETRFPWGQDTITIKGRNAGVQALTVHFDGETLNIVDFLNQDLKAEYASLYETIMSACEAKLKSGDIFAHNFPEAKIACKEITTPPDNSARPTNDTELTETLLKEYHACLDDLKVHFKHYEAHVERWFNGLSEDEKNA
jgi:hypothetical protein